MRDDDREILARASRGDSHADSLVNTRVYDELRVIARRRATPAMEPTVLVHEAFLKLYGREDAVDVRSRTHFFALASRAMRQVVVDGHRRESAAKRGGGDWQRQTLSGVALDRDEAAIDAVELDAALEELRALDPREASVVEMKFFGGMTTAEIADELEVSVTTIEADWRHARAWLKKRLG